MPAVDATRREMSTNELMALLRERYPKAEYAFFTEVPNGTGSHANRHADALAMSLWPSRGLYLTGFELKISRSDWVKELKNPAKAESIAQYCDFWFLVVGSQEIIQAGELPPNWGLLAPTGGKLKVITQPTKLEPRGLDRMFVAGLFRRAQEQITKEAEMSRIRMEEYTRGRKAGHESRDYEVESLRAKIEKFEEASSVKLDEWRFGSIVEAMNLVENGLVGDVAARLASFRKQAERIIELIDADGKEGE